VKVQERVDEAGIEVRHGDTVDTAEEAQHRQDGRTEAAE